MISGHVFIATSLDGFIARTDGDIGWLLERDDPLEDHGYDDFIENIDVILMGRGTYESVQHVRPWPYARPVLILSGTLDEQHIPAELTGKIRFSTCSPTQAMTMLAAEGHQRVYVDGGRIIQSFLQAGLIADLVITHIPVLLGQGRALFGALPGDIPLVHEHTRTFASGLVQSRYRVAS
ncbi:Pyrimidine deaminase [Serratia rubidaea]|uniref:Pyrimidine deaminase n=1 Tax=Serratia rubidaea TaxID=61652 RepID=A0A4U9HUU8_SERRU|nr:dihydrofolate reductase family protein [Serratia rubidaea]MCR0997020.1 dihydrofolate reductase family protein [Serratia rubidaea]QPR64464.1 dihydrofolate reductase [Serratia rubidaea]CAI1038667.1 Pyrimidine deaminase [Serratia rubidaea]CAI1872458.1 Pyrimidine deaminase [Serratia rubidaea]VTP67526.1 Pyrimidine deaminase [Serratia rubidaea]